MSLSDNSRYNLNPQSDRPDVWLSLEVYVKSDNPNLLLGLDRLLELGLIDRERVIEICRRNLSCTLPVKKAIASISDRENISAKVIDRPLVEVASEPNIINRVWHNFLDELSIRWLLFIGIFLVVISSGVLAASQWNNFPRLGQYFIFLAYTIGFWGFGFWSSKQDNLRLTSQTLSAIALLLVPINCWIISYFRLGNNVLEWIALPIALMILTTIVYKQSDNNKFFTALFLLLSYLHLVWQFIPSPLIAVYGGIVAVSLIYYFLLLPRRKYSGSNLLFILSAWSLLLVRVLLNDNNYIADCGIAIAIFGWILATIYLTKEKQFEVTASESLTATQLTNTFLSKVFQIISIILFTITWLLSVLIGILDSSLFFWQTVGISALAIHLFSQRLTIYWRKRDLTAIFFIGLQTLYIAKELIPPSFRSNALNLAVTISKTEYLPESVFGVTLFPYVILFIAIASWLYRRQKSDLALYAEILTMLLGITLTCLSLANPTWRSLNLLFSTLALGYVAWIRLPVRTFLIYLTHLLGLATIVNGIDVILPDRSQPVWGSILVALMAGEWFVYRHRMRKSNQGFQSILVTSCWYAGLLLAAASYLCLAFYKSDRFFSGSISVSIWGLVWFVTPAMLTWIAKHTTKIQQRRSATIISCIGLIVAQVLVLGHPIIRAIGLICAIALMIVNTFHLRRTWVAGIGIGFGLSLIASLFSNFISNENWLIVGAIAILSLYQFRRYLKRILNTPKFNYISQRTAPGILGVGRETRNFKLIDRYIQAADYWTIALIALEVAILSIIYSNMAYFDNYFAYSIATVLTLIGVVWRYRQQPNNLVLYTLVWLVELLTVGITSFLGGNEFSFAIANIGLALLAWALIQQLAKNTAWAKLHLGYIPLIYTALGIFWRLSFYNIYTGLITLGAAFILINTPQHNRQLNLITNYLGFIAVSFGIYEIVIYRMQQSSGGSVADGLTILSLVAAAIAFCYRLAAWWYSQRQRTTIFNLSLPKVVLVAHIHWAISSMLKIIAASIAIEATTPRLTPLSIATSFCLGAYAVIQGKDRHQDTVDKANDWWVYVGLVEITATLVYSRLIIDRLSFFDPWRIVFTCAIALFIYQIPWHNFGWRTTPWQRAAAIAPALMALVTAEDISYLSLLATAAFYLRIAYYQKNLRWSYISLGFINWALLRLTWQFNTEFIWLAGIISLSILYIAQFDPYLRPQRRQRYFVSLLGCSVICIVALFYQDSGIIPGAIGFILILSGLGFKIRALLFSGTVTLILTVFYQLTTLILAYSFLKWIAALIAGTLSIIMAAGFEKNSDRKQHRQSSVLKAKLYQYAHKLQDWQ